MKLAILKKTSHYKMSELQELILREIGRGINTSKASLARHLDKHHSDVSDAVDILSDKGYIIQKGEKQGRGKKEKFYILSDFGIEQLIKLKIELEDFWNLIFFVFDEGTGHELKVFTIDKLFCAYEKDVLMLSREYSTPLYDWAVAYFQYLKRNPARLEPTVKILSILAKNQPLSIKEILKCSQVPKSKCYMYYSTKPKSSAIINNMITFLLINEIEKNKKYRLSHFGVLLLLTELFDKISGTRHVLEQSETKEIIRAITTNYRDLFPLIFGNWNVLSRILTEEELVRTFRMMLNYEESRFSAEPIQNGGLYELFSILKSMRRTYQNKLEELLEIGKNVRKEWFKKNQITKSHNLESILMQSMVRHKIMKQSSPNSIDAVLAKIEDLTMEAISYDLQSAAKFDLVEHQLNDLYKRKTVKQTLVDLITHLFFTLLIYQVRFRLDMLLHINTCTKEPAEVKESINKISNNWKLFLDKNKDFVKSYPKWISTIIEYESQNVDLIKQLSSFAIKSSVEQRRQNLYFTKRLLPKLESYIATRDSF